MFIDTRNNKSIKSKEKQEGEEAEEEEEEEEANLRGNDIIDSHHSDGLLKLLSLGIRSTSFNRSFDRYWQPANESSLL